MSEHNALNESQNPQTAPLDLRIGSRLTALFIHELNNDLATMREKAGLAGDLLEAKKLPDSDKLKGMDQIISSVAARITRAAGLAQSFSVFGREMGTASAEADLGSILAALAPFFEKVAKQRSLTFSRASGFESLTVAAAPYPLACLIFGLFDNLCSSAGEGAPIQISLKKEASAVVITLSISSTPLTREEAGLPWPEADIKAFAAAHGLSPEHADGGREISLRLSRK